MNLTIKNALFIIWILMLGVISGFFYTYSINVSRAFMEVDADTYAIMQSLCNINVRHSLFYIFFFGTPLIGSICLFSSYKDFKKSYYIITIFTLLLYMFGIIIFTKIINLPLNVYTESWVVGNVPNDWEEVRNRWNFANHIRTGISLICFTLTLISYHLKISK